MDLLVDAGNTNVKYALSEGSRIELINKSQLAGILSKICRVVVANVGQQPEVEELLAILKPTAQIKLASVSQQQSGINCGYNNPSNLGVDRWLAILGATQKFSNENLVIVDAGTALTVDAVSSDGNHIGGWIIPGLQLMQQAIIDKAPLVFTNEHIQAESFGSDTPSAVYHGCLYALTGAIERAQFELEKQLNVSNAMDITTVLTGGDAMTIAAKIDGPLVIDSELVFKGLVAILND